MPKIFIKGEDEYRFDFNTITLDQEERLQNRGYDCFEITPAQIKKWKNLQAKYDEMQKELSNLSNKQNRARDL